MEIEQFVCVRPRLLDFFSITMNILYLLFIEILSFETLLLSLDNR